MLPRVLCHESVESDLPIREAQLEGLSLEVITLRSMTAAYLHGLSAISCTFPTDLCAVMIHPR